ncbi:NUDIX domain-containing protein [Rhodococcus sp. IEGM 1408]|uniref:NUDIX domain-containing protein n=1 Tax=Rhodococcus sp. IEGM 1408 TaxID=3082220 RepID=UPI002955BD86|nr:NUDIX domain-containing protein [Rhodococcus sp. IEGM 1408]MDV8001632.1 NUDIX domain-containing protein [Rhodococcus sp. IEGM 1408]
MAASEGDGNGWVVSAGGDRRWGRFGAAGLLLRAADPTDPDTPLVLLQHRAVWTASGDTWALPGGARDSFEDAPEAALRETQEEAEIRPDDVIVRAVRVTSRMPGTVWHRPGLDMRHVAEMMRRLRPDQHHTENAVGADGRPRTIPPLVQESADAVEWTYTTVVADAPHALDTVPNNESLELRWVPESLVAELPLMPAFAQAWADGLRTEPVELVVDVANVLGSRPDGWWRDRAGATTRLLDELGAALPRTIELPGGFGWVARAHAVIEGAARGAEHSGPLVVHRAPGSGDDAIADLAAELAADLAVGGSRRVVVVTADRGLRARLPGCVLVVGPRALLG